MTYDAVRVYDALWKIYLAIGLSRGACGCGVCVCWQFLSMHDVDEGASYYKP